jgi:hypothetical protein
MNTRVRTISKAIAGILFSSAVFAGTAEAKIVSPSKDIVVDQPTDLPELAQRQGLAFQLYTGSGDGGVYLYVEQHHGERLLVLDVTDPGNIKMVGAATLTVPGPFDFVRPLGSSALLVRFRNNLGVAVLDLKKAKTPVLKTVSGLQYPGHTENLGQTGFLMENQPHVDGQAVAHDYQIVDTANPADPALVYTAKLVTHKLTREETGTTFLLGAEGLTIIRLPQEEDDYKARQNPAN